MAGHRGAVPKPAGTRARRNVDQAPTTAIRFVFSKQPALPARMPDGRAWPTRTRAWWKRWKTDARAEKFDAAAWDELLDTAVVHGRLWLGEVSAASELRLRTAKFGVTPDDRARARIVYVGAGDEPKAERGGAPARARYHGLHSVQGGVEPAG